MWRFGTGSAGQALHSSSLPGNPFLSSMAETTSASVVAASPGGLPVDGGDPLPRHVGANASFHIGDHFLPQLTFIGEQPRILLKGVEEEGYIGTLLLHPLHVVRMNAKDPETYFFHLLRWEAGKGFLHCSAVDTLPLRHRENGVEAETHTPARSDRLSSVKEPALKG